MQENALSLTQPLRQDPQEIQGSSLDADTARQHRAQAAPQLRAGGCRAVAEPQYRHHSCKQGRLGPGRGALGLGRGASVSASCESRRQGGRGPGHTYQGLQQLQVGQRAAQETHARRLGGRERVHGRRVAFGPLQQACGRPDTGPGEQAPPARPPVTESHQRLGGRLQAVALLSDVWSEPVCWALKQSSTLPAARAGAGLCWSEGSSLPRHGATGHSGVPCLTPKPSCN